MKKKPAKYQLIAVDPKIGKDLKKLAAEKGTTMRAIAEDAIAKCIEDEQNKNKEDA